MEVYEGRGDGFQMAKRLRPYKSGDTDAEKIVASFVGVMPRLPMQESVV